MPPKRRASVPEKQRTNGLESDAAFVLALVRDFEAAVARKPANVPLDDA